MMTHFWGRGAEILNSSTNRETHYFLLEAAGLAARLHKHTVVDYLRYMRLHKMLLIHFILQLGKEMLQ